MAHMGTVIEGKYEILKQIGRGGMSVVYLAMDKRLNKQWAVKEVRKFARDKKDKVVIQSLLARRSLQAQLQVHTLFFLLLSKQFLKTRNKAHPCALTRLFVVLCPGVHGCSLCMTTVSVCIQF